MTFTEPLPIYRHLRRHVVTLQLTGYNIKERAATVAAGICERLEELQDRREAFIRTAAIPVTIARPRIALGADIKRCPPSARSEATPVPASPAKLRQLAKLIEQLSPEERASLGL